MPPPEETWLSRKAAAIYLTRLGCPVTHRTLGNLGNNNNAGGGPPFVRSGWRSVRYLQSELDAWAKKRMRRIE
jgi:hypothetical protein